jgi:hypothetical protein
VAVNRERAGLHYASDSRAGDYIAQRIVNALKVGGTVGCTILNGGGLPGGTDLMALAAVEWPV